VADDEQRQARLTMVFSSGSVASVVLQYDAALAMLENIRNIANIIHTANYPETQRAAYHFFIRGGTVTHATLVPLDAAKPRTVEEFARDFVPDANLPQRGETPA
jgi:hypothetical protein